MKAVELELFTHRFAALAREMGEMLRAHRHLHQRQASGSTSPAPCSTPPAPWSSTRRTSPSTSAPSASACGRLREALTIGPGDVVVTNHPGFGGSHLPDVTVVTPVYAEGARRPAQGTRAALRSAAATPPAAPTTPSWAAPAPARCRRRPHARRGGGGDRPAPAGAARAGALGGDAPHCSRRPPWPSRAVEPRTSPTSNAARRRQPPRRRGLARPGRRPRPGARRARRWTPSPARAAALLRAALAAAPRRPLREAERAARRRDARWRSRSRCAATGPRVDFTGSAPVHPGNLNATPAVVRSAVLYVLRLLVAEPLPLNEGLLAPVDAGASRAGLLNPRFPARPARGRRRWSAATSRPASGSSTPCSSAPSASPPAARGR